MDYTDFIVDLYEAVNEDQRQKFYICSADVRQAFLDMKEAYLPNKLWECNCASKVADYNQPAHRYAYLHKHAMLHTGLLCEVLQSAFMQSNLYSFINSKRSLNICSLGGGPGTDVVALLLVIKQVFDFMPLVVSVVDFSREWRHVFEAIVGQLKRYPFVKDMANRLTYEYLSADLLHESYWNQYKVRNAVINADLVTMIKFISAAACEKTRKMVSVIFKFMKPGALLIFVDNAAGGFLEMLTQVANMCGLRSVYGPKKHYEYEEPRFNRKLYGYTSQHSTKVTIQIWQKPASYNTTQELSREYSNYRYQPTSRGSFYQPQSNENVRLPRREAAARNDCCSII